MLWIGLAEVRQRPQSDVLAGRDEAFVNVVASADALDAFHARVVAALDELGFELLALEEAEPVETRATRHELPEHVRSLAREAGSSGLVAFGTFHTWESDEE